MKSIFAGLLASTILLVQPAMSAGNPQTPPPPGTQVVDSKGTVVGNLLTHGTVIRQITPGLWVAFELQSVGLFGSGPRFRYYPSIDCSGTAYLLTYAVPVRGDIATAGS